MQIVRTSLFAKSIKKLGANAGEIDVLEKRLLSDSEAGDVIQGLRGVRKVRFALKGKGKSGGGRCIYLALTLDEVIYLLLAYDKSVQSDLSSEQRKGILSILEELK
jgi:hypothetical protein